MVSYPNLKTETVPIRLRNNSCVMRKILTISSIILASVIGSGCAVRSELEYHDEGKFVRVRPDGSVSPGPLLGAPPYRVIAASLPVKLARKIVDQELTFHLEIIDCETDKIIHVEDLFIEGLQISHMDKIKFRNYILSHAGDSQRILGLVYLSKEFIGDRHEICILPVGGDIMGTKIVGVRTRVQVSR